MPCCGSVGGCGAPAVSRKTPIYFMFRWFRFSSALISTFTSNLHFGGADFHKAGPERRKGSKQPALDIWTEGG